MSNQHCGHRYEQTRVQWAAVLLCIAVLFFGACTGQSGAQSNSQARRPTDRTTPFPLEYSPNDFYDWNDRVYYQIFVRSFYDSNGDGIGDIQGIIRQLDYLNDGDDSTTTDLGITGIWLMPINPSPSYHGYDVTNYYDIEEDYGTLEDMRQLISEAERRGIHIIKDLVLNHSSIEHPWFLASEQGDAQFRDYYVWSDSQHLGGIDGTNTDIQGPWGQQVWHSLDDENSYYGLFWDRMPDLNYENPRVTEEMHNITRFWLEDVGIHGFRLDAIMYLREEGDILLNTESNHAWFREYYNFYKSVNPNAFTIGEVWAQTFQSAQYVGDEVDLVFEFDLADAMYSAIRNESYKPILQQQERIIELYPRSQYGRFLANHDQTRNATVLRGDIESQKLAASLLLTAPGVPFMYYGEEIGIEGRKPDENLRRPMHWNSSGGFSPSDPWQDYASKLETNNVQTMSADNASLLNRYRSLISLRNQSPALRRGLLVHLPSSLRQVYAYFLYSNEEILLVMHNMSNEQQSDYGLYIDETPLQSMNLELIYWGNSEGNFSGDQLGEYLESSNRQRIRNPRLNRRSGGFENYAPIESLQAQATYIFRVQADMRQ